MIIAHEYPVPLDVKPQHHDQLIFARIDIEKFDHKNPHVLPFAKNITPILHHPGSYVHPTRMTLALTAQLVDEHKAWAQSLHDLGFKRVVISAAYDGALQRLLSPRFSDQSLTHRMGYLLKIYDEVSQIFAQTMVLLTVEELAPGGFDATDGIVVANELYKNGLKEIIATQGTKDFMPLYDRRATQKKTAAQDEFYSQDPSIASAAWLTAHTNLAVFSLAEFDDVEKASATATIVGLKGLINRS